MELIWCETIKNELIIFIIEIVFVVQAKALREEIWKLDFFGFSKPINGTLTPKNIKQLQFEWILKRTGI